MAQFKSKEEYEAEAKDPVLNVIFKIKVGEGELPVPQAGTARMLEEILKRYAIEGVTLHNRKGFTWYPPHSIRKVDVETQ